MADPRSNKQDENLSSKKRKEPMGSENDDTSVVITPTFSDILKSKNINKHSSSNSTLSSDSTNKDSLKLKPLRLSDENEKSYNHSLQYRIHSDFSYNQERFKHASETILSEAKDDLTRRIEKVLGIFQDSSDSQSSDPDDSINKYKIQCSLDRYNSTVSNYSKLAIGSQNVHKEDCSKKHVRWIDAEENSFKTATEKNDSNIFCESIEYLRNGEKSSSSSNIDNLHLKISAPQENPENIQTEEITSFHHIAPSTATLGTATIDLSTVSSSTSSDFPPLQISNYAPDYSSSIKRSPRNRLREKESSGPSHFTPRTSDLSVESDLTVSSDFPLLQIPNYIPDYVSPHKMLPDKRLIKINKPTTTEEFKSNSALTLSSQQSPVTVYQDVKCFAEDSNKTTVDESNSSSTLTSQSFDSVLQDVKRLAKDIISKTTVDKPNSSTSLSSQQSLDTVLQDVKRLAKDIISASKINISQSTVIPEKSNAIHSAKSDYATIEREDPEGFSVNKELILPTFQIASPLQPNDEQNLPLEEEVVLVLPEQLTFADENNLSEHINHETVPKNIANESTQNVPKICKNHGFHGLHSKRKPPLLVIDENEMLDVADHNVPVRKYLSTSSLEQISSEPDAFFSRIQWYTFSDDENDVQDATTQTTSSFLKTMHKEVSENIQNNQASYFKPKEKERIDENLNIHQNLISHFDSYSSFLKHPLLQDKSKISDSNSCSEQVNQTNPFIYPQGVPYHSESVSKQDDTVLQYDSVDRTKLTSQNLNLEVATPSNIVQLDLIMIGDDYYVRQKIGASGGFPVYIMRKYKGENHGIIETVERSPTDVRIFILEPDIPEQDSPSNSESSVHRNSSPVPNLTTSENIESSSLSSRLKCIRNKFNKQHDIVGEYIIKQGSSLDALKQMISECEGIRIKLWKSRSMPLSDKTSSNGSLCSKDDDSENQTIPKSFIPIFDKNTDENTSRNKIKNPKHSPRKSNHSENDIRTPPVDDLKSRQKWFVPFHDNCLVHNHDRSLTLQEAFLVARPQLKYRMHRREYQIKNAAVHREMLKKSKITEEKREPSLKHFLFSSTKPKKIHPMQYSYAQSSKYQDHKAFPTYSKSIHHKTIFKQFSKKRSIFDNVYQQKLRSQPSNAQLKKQREDQKAENRQNCRKFSKNLQKHLLRGRVNWSPFESVMDSNKYFI